MLYRFCTLALVIVLLTSCGKKKKTMAGEDEVNIQEYIEFFPEVTLPFSYSDSALYAPTHDSLLISPEIFNEFTPDSVLAENYGADQPKLYAIGKFKDKDGYTYLMSKAATEKLKVMYITAYDNKNAFVAALPVMKSKANKEVAVTVTINKLFNIYKKSKKVLPNGIEITGDDVYVLSGAARKFILVMTDLLGDEAELINPIDTLGTTFKYAGDYGVGARNIISVRDDIRPGRVQLFIHLEEKNSDCKGELMGEGIITSDNTVEYRQAGDPCVLELKFQKNSVTLNEVRGCGSRMGALDCTFNGTYPKKKKEQQPSDKSAKKTS